jgi:hypothetical protein
LYNRKLSNTEDNSSFSSANNSSYLHYLENNTSNTQDLFYDRIYQQQNQHLLMSNIGLDLDIPDYQQQKPQYNWLYDPNNNFLPTHTNMFYDESIMTGIIPPPTPTNNQQSYDCFMSENENIMVEGGMSRGYVSLSVSLFYIRL